MAAKNKNSKSQIIICCAIVIFVPLIIFSCFKIPRAVMKPEDVVIKFSEEFNNRNYKKMLRYVEPSKAKIIKSSLELLPSNISEAALEGILPFIADVTNTKLYPQILNINIEKKRSVITVQFKTLDEKNYYDIYLTKKKGIWYIDGVWLSSKK